MKESAKSECGTYITVLKSNKSGTLQVGKFGLLSVSKGYYVYIGSAFGPGGIKSRLSHHVKISSSPHWHIDYLRTETVFHKAYAAYSYAHKECSWASTFAEDLNSVEPLKGFGSSDCSCRTHLYYFKTSKMVDDAIIKLDAVKEVLI